MHKIHFERVLATQQNRRHNLARELAGLRLRRWRAASQIEREQLELAISIASEGLRAWSGKTPQNLIGLITALIP